MFPCRLNAVQIVNAVTSSGTWNRLTAKESHVCQIGFMALWDGFSLSFIAIGDDADKTEEEDLLGEELLLLLLLVLLLLLFL